MQALKRGPSGPGAQALTNTRPELEAGPRASDDQVSESSPPGGLDRLDRALDAVIGVPPSSMNELMTAKAAVSLMGLTYAYAHPYGAERLEAAAQALLPTEIQAVRASFNGLTPEQVNLKARYAAETNRGQTGFAAIHHVSDALQPHLWHLTPGGSAGLAAQDAPAARQFAREAVLTCFDPVKGEFRGERLRHKLLVDMTGEAWAALDEELFKLHGKHIEAISLPAIGNPKDLRRVFRALGEAQLPQLASMHMKLPVDHVRPLEIDCLGLPHLRTLKLQGTCPPEDLNISAFDHVEVDVEVVMEPSSLRGVEIRRFAGAGAAALQAGRLAGPVPTGVQAGAAPLPPLVTILQDDLQLTREQALGAEQLLLQCMDRNEQWEYDFRLDRLSQADHALVCEIGDRVFEALARHAEQSGGKLTMATVGPSIAYHKDGLEAMKTVGHQPWLRRMNLMVDNLYIDKRSLDFRGVLRAGAELNLLLPGNGSDLYAFTDLPALSRKPGFEQVHFFRTFTDQGVRLMENGRACPEEGLEYVASAGAPVHMSTGPGQELPLGLPIDGVRAHWCGLQDLDHKVVAWYVRAAWDGRVSKSATLQCGAGDSQYLMFAHLRIGHAIAQAFIQGKVPVGHLIPAATALADQHLALQYGKMLGAVPWSVAQRAEILHSLNQHPDCGSVVEGFLSPAVTPVDRAVTQCLTQ